MQDSDIYNAVFPIRSMDVYKNGIVFRRKSLLQERHERTGVRGKIKELSMRSLSRAAFVAKNTDTRFYSMITLTYPKDFPLNGKESKQHLRYMLNQLKYDHTYLEYLWFLEFQTKRLAPHYHVLTNILTPNHHMRDRLARQWAQIVSRETIEQDKVWKVHKHERTWEGIREEDGAIRYLTLYVTKPKQKRVPANFENVGRFWGHSTGVTPKALVYNVNIDNDGAMEYIENRIDRAQNWSTIPKFVWFK